MVYVVTATGLNKNGEPYSKLVPMVELRTGNAFLDEKNGLYVKQQYPLLKRFTNEFTEVEK